MVERISNDSMRRVLKNAIYKTADSLVFVAAHPDQDQDVSLKHHYF